MRFDKPSMIASVISAISLLVSGCAASSTAPFARPSPVAGPATASSSPTGAAEAKESECAGDKMVEVPVCVLEQCEEDAMKADQRDKALQAAEQSKENADRAEGALDLCERRREEVERKSTWLTVGAVVGWVGAVGLGVWGAVQAAD